MIEHLTNAFLIGLTSILVMAILYNILKPYKENLPPTILYWDQCINQHRGLYLFGILLSGAAIYMLCICFKVNKVRCQNGFLMIID